MEYMKIGRFCDPAIQGVRIPAHMTALTYTREWDGKEWHKVSAYSGERYRQYRAKKCRRERVHKKFPAFVKLGKGKVRISNRIY